MELGVEEAQICRLCGQYESIYIDVFGEEGTKRFLGLKIHKKINILIDARDPLPKAICVQCLGKLEFVCDFQEECLRTQQVLRDRYNLPPLTEIVEVKTEHTTPSTSTNNNNDETNKNLNSPNENSNKDVEQRVLRTATKTQRSLRSQQQAKSNDEATKEQNSSQNTSEESAETEQTVHSPETTLTRWLRSRQSTEISASNETAAHTSIANRLRSHDNTATEITLTPRNNLDENGEKQSGKQQDPHTLQIPTSALNKLLTIVSNSPNIEVSVKESKNQNSDIEDISFTVELCKKESDDVATVHARVFPDQGTCLVDKAIVNLLQNQNCVEVNTIINTIISSSLKNGNSGKLKDSAEFEHKWQASQNPQELFRIDGEEIRVDDNVEHVVTDNQNGYSCKLCCKFYERKDKCMVHVKTHLGIKQYTCILCNAKFVCKSDVMKHIRCSHTNPRPIQCPKCPKRFKSKFYLMEHDNVHKGVRPYSCTDCGQSYHHKVSLQIHMKSHLPPQNLACEYCGKVFPYRTRLLSHVASVHLKNRRNFRCRFCYNLYSSLSVLNEHIKTRHATTYTCEVCSKTFKVASKYKAHVLQHSNPKPFVCNVCNNRYASKAFLNEHLLKHEGLRKHICQKCGARFAQASHLAAHRHVHGEKKHVCPECGRRFNRRDNMKMRENDGLPRIVCMRCLGTLEFLCDFYERCHLTQKELLEASQNEENRKLLQQSDEESDKENAAPKVNEVKQKSKAKPPNSSISTKNSLTESNRAEKNHSVTDITQSVAKSSSPLKKKILTKQSTLDNIFSKEKIPNNDRSTAGNLRHRKSLPASTEDDSKVLRTARSLSGLNLSLKNIDINSVLPVRRKRGRKSKLEKMREASLLASIKKEMNDDFDERRSGNFNDQGKRYGLRAIFSTAKSNNVTGNAVLSSKEHVEQIVPKKQAVVVSTSSNASHDKAKETNSEHRNDILAKKPRKVEFSSKSTDNSDNSSKSTEDDSEKSAGISIIIKQEKTETESVLPKQNEKCNKLVWIPNEILMEKGENLMKDQSLDKMDVEDIYSDMITSPDCNDQKSTIVTDQDNATFTKSTESNDEIANLNTVEKDKKRLCNSDDEMTENSKIDLVYSVRGRSSLRRLTNSQDNFNESKSKDKSFGKISELISDEQKQAIETYYTVDMSVINEEEVQKNITIVDKKNVRCNICGIIYIRMDKCLVHIWGHLQMKPYQCKTCDFSTVTVSNVRCHIRKSHLKIKPFACHLCEKRYLTSILLEEHINTHTGARPYKCKTCDFASSSRQILSYHNTTHKPVKDINCKICGKEFYSRNRLRSHMIIHNKDKVVACKFCSAYLSNAEALETHCRNLHTQDYVCNICGKRAKSRKALYNHMNVHAAAKYKCTLCPNVYKSSQILKEHLLKHKGIRKYKCSVCEKSFGQQSHLAAHMAVHSKIRFHCPGCNKPFNRQDNMKIHTKRCKLFLANPELKSRLIKREKIISFDNITELTSELKARDMNKSMSCVKRQTDEAPIKTINDEDNASDCDSESESDICFNEPANKTLDHDRCQGADDILTSAELNVIKITNVADKLTTENRKFSVLENVLGPESY